MGRRTLLNKYQVLNAVDSATSPESIQTDISGVDYFTYQLLIDASVNALASIQVCSDIVISPSSVFVELDFTQTLPIIGAVDADYMITVENQGFKWAKLVTTNNGGTGLISASITGTTRGA